MGQRGRHSAQEIVDTLRRADELAAAGMALEETAAEVGVSRATLNNWQRTFGGMTVAAIGELRESRKRAGVAQRQAKITGSIHREPYAPRMSLSDRRCQLLDAAARVVGERGPHMVSLETVAHEAGVSRTVVYSVFDTSLKILPASLERETGAAREQLAAVFDPTLLDPTDVPQALTGMVRRFVGAVSGAPDRWRALAQCTHSPTPAVRQWRDEHGALFLDEVTSFVEAIALTTDQDRDEIELAARVVHALLWEMARIAFDDPGRFSTERVVECVAVAVNALPGLGAAQASSTERYSR